jgi:hypothetical protein
MSHCLRVSINALGTEGLCGSGDSASVSEELRSGLGETVKPNSPPLFYRNEFGAVTNRRQFRHFYRHELTAGQPLGPHVFARG